MTEQHINQICTDGSICKKRDFMKVVIAVLLIVTGLAFFIFAGNFVSAGDTFEMGAYIGGAIAFIIAIWLLLSSGGKLVEKETGSKLKKEVYYIKSADVRNIENGLRDMGVLTTIKNLGDGSYRLVSLHNNNIAFVAFYQYVPHEYTTVSDVVMVKNNNINPLINLLKDNSI